jgi:hypothetical protein
MAYTFNGTNQTLRVESGIVSAYPFTIAATCNVSSVASTFQAIVAINPGASANEPYIHMGHRNNGIVAAGLIDASGTVFTAVNSPSNTFAIGTQFWIAATFTSSKVDVFFNGSNVGSSSNLVTSFPSGFARTSIASLDRQLPTAYVAGSIAETAIWNVELTAAEIASLAAGFTPDQIRPQSLQFYAPLIRNLADLRLGRTITNVGGAGVSTHPRIIQ